MRTNYRGLYARNGAPATARDPILKTRTFERAAPTAADPREKLLWESVGECSGNVLKTAADRVPGRALTKIESEDRFWRFVGEKIAFGRFVPRHETRPGVAVPALGRPDGLTCRKHHK